MHGGQWQLEKELANGGRWWRAAVSAVLGRGIKVVSCWQWWMVAGSSLALCYELLLLVQCWVVAASC